jgi:hypothetical protein
MGKQQSKAQASASKHKQQFGHTSQQITQQSSSSSHLAGRSAYRKQESDPPTPQLLRSRSDPESPSATNLQISHLGSEYDRRTPGCIPLWLGYSPASSLQDASMLRPPARSSNTAPGPRVLSPKYFAATRLRVQAGILTLQG